MPDPDLSIRPLIVFFIAGATAWGNALLWLLLHARLSHPETLALCGTIWLCIAVALVACWRVRERWLWWGSLTVMALAGISVPFLS